MQCINTNILVYLGCSIGNNLYILCADVVFLNVVGTIQVSVKHELKYSGNCEIIRKPGAWTCFRKWCLTGNFSGVP